MSLEVDEEERQFSEIRGDAIYTRALTLND